MKIAALAALPLVLAALSAPIAARAAEVAPEQGFRGDFRSGASVLVYYTPEKDGFHVVATIQSDDSEHQSVMRVSAVLLPGQSTVLSVPAAAGAQEDSVRITRRGDVLVVGGAKLATVSN